MILLKRLTFHLRIKYNFTERLFFWASRMFIAIEFYMGWLLNEYLNIIFCMSRAEWSVCLWMLSEELHWEKPPARSVNPSSRETLRLAHFLNRPVCFSVQALIISSVSTSRQCFILLTASIKKAPLMKV